MSMRITDEQIRKFLSWAQNYQEIKSFKKIEPGTGRCWLIRLHYPVTAGMTIGDIGTLFGPTAREIVPPEIVLTGREALMFGMGCAVGGTAKSRGDWTQADWDQQAQENRDRDSRKWIDGDEDEWEYTSVRGNSFFRRKKPTSQSPKTHEQISR